MCATPRPLPLELCTLAGSCLEVAVLDVESAMLTGLIFVELLAGLDMGTDDLLLPSAWFCSFNFDMPLLSEPTSELKEPVALASDLLFLFQDETGLDILCAELRPLSVFLVKFVL